MTCPQAQDLLLTFLYGELDPEGTRALTAHLEACPRCAQAAAGLARVRERLAARTDPAPSQLAVQRILAHARDQAARPRATWAMAWLKAAVPACFVVAVGAWVIMHHGRFTAPEGPTAPQGGHEAAHPAQEAPADPGEAPDAVGLGAGAAPKAAEPAPPSLDPAPRQDEKETDRPSPPGPRPRTAQRKERGTQPGASRPAPPVQEETPPPARPSPSAPQPTQGPPLERPMGPAGSRGPAAREKAIEAPSPLPMREAQTAASDSEELARGEALLRGRDYGGARAALSTLVAALPQGHPHLPRALLGLARAEEGLGRLDEARALYRELARVSPEHRGLALERIRALEAPAKAAPGP